jgi:hypothetical protein
MRCLVLLLSLVFAVASCARKQDAGSAGADKGPLPDGMKILVDPASKTAKAGQKVRVWAENNTGKKFTVEWKADGHCGTFEVEKTKGLEALFVAGQYGMDCTQKVEFKASGTSGIYETSLDIVVKGNPAFAQLDPRPNPIPDNWVMVNDYETSLDPKEVKCTMVVGGKKRVSVGLAFGADKHKKEGSDSKAPEAAGDEPKEVTESYDGILLNKLDAPFGPWTFEFGSCEMADPPENEKGTFALSYDLPNDDAYCGYFETFSMGKDCESAPFDVAPFEKLSFIVKSGDGKPHRLFVELVAWEKYAEFHQGRTEAVGPFEVPVDAWKRYDVELKDLIKDALAPSSIKSVSFKLTRDKQPDGGVILFDNIALIKGAQK